MTDVRLHTNVLNWFSAVGVVWIAVVAIEDVAGVVLAESNGYAGNRDFFNVPLGSINRLQSCCCFEANQTVRRSQNIKI